MGSAFVQKLVWTVLALVVWMVAAVPYFASIAPAFHTAAGVIFGGAWITSPGHGALIEAGKKATSVPPIAKVGLVLLLALLPGCATLRDAKPVARAVNDIARELCEATMGAEAKREGIGVKELCLLPYVIGPFLQAEQLASANVVLGRELETPRCTP